MMAEASVFKIGMRIGFGGLIIKLLYTARQKWAWPWATGTPQICDSPLIFMQWL